MIEFKFSTLGKCIEAKKALDETSGDFRESLPKFKRGKLLTIQEVDKLNNTLDKLD